MQGTLPTIAKIDKRFFLLLSSVERALLAVSVFGQRQRAGQIDVTYVTRSCPTYRLIPKPESVQSCIICRAIFATVTDPHYKEGNEMAQPVAGAFLFAGLCRTRRALFSALGHSKTFRNYLVCWRRPYAGTACPDACVRRWGRYTPEPGFHASCSFANELLERFRRSGSSSRRNCNCNRRQNDQPRDRDQWRWETDHEHH